MDENLEFHIKVSLKCLICQLLQLLHRVVFSSNSQNVRVKVRMMGWDNYSNVWFWRIKMRSHHCWGCGSGSKASWVTQNVPKQIKMAFAPGIILAPRCRSGPAKASTGHINTRISSQYLLCFFIASLLVEDKMWLKVGQPEQHQWWPFVSVSISPLFPPFFVNMQVSYFEIYMDKIRDLLDGACVYQSHLCL